MSYSNTNYPIQPTITKTVVTTYDSYTINNLTVTPFTQATMIIQMFSKDKPDVYSQLLVMEGDAYAQWGGDDEYLINWVNTQLHSIQ